MQQYHCFIEEILQKPFYFSVKRATFVSMIEIDNIITQIACFFPWMALIILTFVHILRADKWKKTEELLKNEITLLRQANQQFIEKAQQEEEEQQKEAAQSSAGLSARESLLMSQLKETILNNYFNPEFGVDQLADALGISRSSLNRRMRDTLKTTANHYIRDIRILKAEELLRSSSMQVNEICYKVGFQTPSYFIKCFRKKYGKSPNEYANSSIKRLSD